MNPGSCPYHEPHTFWKASGFPSHSSSSCTGWTSTAASCLFSRQVGKAILHLSEALTSCPAPCWTGGGTLMSPLKRQRKGHGVTWLICTSPSCNPTCNSRCVWLIPGTLTQHSYTTLARSWAASREAEGRAAGRPDVLPRSWELTRALSRTAEHVGFGTGHRGKAPSQSRTLAPHTLQFHKLCHFFFFLGGYLGLEVMNYGPYQLNILFCKLPLWKLLSLLSPSLVKNRE